MALTREDLDMQCSQGCQAEGCTHREHNELFLSARCHPKEGVHVKYSLESKRLTLQCAVCERTIAIVEVASRALILQDESLKTMLSWLLALMLDNDKQPLQVSLRATQEAKDIVYGRKSLPAPIITNLPDGDRQLTVKWE